jgi:FAD/FMN-containing dehydrogenase
MPPLWQSGQSRSVGSRALSFIADCGNRTARISGGARAADVVAITDPVGHAVVTGSVGAVGMVGLTLGGGYGPLIGRFGLATDNLAAAEVVLADGRIVVASADDEAELLWSLRGGGGNFGVVTAMHQRLHHLPSVCSSMLIYSFAEAKAVLQRLADIAPAMPDLAQLFKLGTVLANSVDVMPYGASLTVFDPYLVNGQRVIMDTCWIHALDSGSIDAFIQGMETAVSAGCAIFTHEFKGAASRVPVEATAFGLRRDHLLVEILAVFPDRPSKLEEQRHQQWARATLHGFAATALPGGYPNFLTDGDKTRVAKSYGPNAGRLIKAKQHYDPDNVFAYAIYRSTE